MCFPPRELPLWLYDDEGTICGGTVTCDCVTEVGGVEPVNEGSIGAATETICTRQGFPYSATLLPLVLTRKMVPIMGRASS